MVKSVIIDCDPGVDDAIAILLALATDSLNILAITTVAGNVPLHYTTNNALKICQLAGRPDLPIYPGCPRPMLKPLHTATEVHGATGLQGAELPAPSAPPQPQHAVEYLIHTLSQAAEPITLATLGPLTNVALALIQKPSIAQNIQEIVAMGGAVTHGNVTPSAEFNIYVDPHAAEVVFSAGIPTTLITLDTTHQVLTTAERLQTIRDLGSPVAQAAADLLAHYGHADAERYGMPGSPLHDPCVIAYLMQPHLFGRRPVPVSVAVDAGPTQGRTVIDWWHRQEGAINVTDAVDTPAFYDL
ncbi:MAG: nucleoside hydrolase, partial [Cyanobacteria bacterium J06632_22]